MYWTGSEPGSKPITCNYCSGRGKVRSNQGFFTIQQTCPECSGYGETIGNLAGSVEEMENSV